ncbi:Uroporphyrinogen-III synthase, chloroplastic, partial [Tetrabaena socialis]
RTVAARSVCAQALATAPSPKVLLTREAGKNDKLLQALTRKGFTCIELPLIEHTDGPDRVQLPELLRGAAGSYDWVTITSPEAAAVFLEGWRQAGKPEVRVAVVGGGTGEVLLQGGVTPAYVPSKALGKVMGSELPRVEGGSGRVLYPASTKASTDLQDSLVAAGFEVHRINTYNTSSVKSVPEAQLREALSADVVTYGSPSAVKAWVALAGLELANAKVNACIGSTSARACASAGITAHVCYPEAPGIEGWVEAVERGCREMQLALPAA